MDLGGLKAFPNQQRKQSGMQALRGRPVSIYLWHRNGLHFWGIICRDFVELRRLQAIYAKRWQARL
jgi:hypothetical protein